jgi:hypothetical protein
MELMKDGIPFIDIEAFPVRIGSKPYPHPGLEWETYVEFNEQLIEHVEWALSHKDKPWLVTAVMANFHRVLGAYIDAGFRSLEAMEEQVRDHLVLSYRMARRAFIRVCIRDGLDPLTSGPECIREEYFDEDLAAVERHLREGVRLNDGLWKSKAEREQMGLQGAERAAS